MNKEEYINKRVCCQIDWHSKKATINKRWFIFISIFSIIVSFIVSITIKICGEISFYISFIVPLCSSILTLLNFKEKWNLYRSTEEILKSELFKFKTQVGKYSNDENSFEIFVDTIENILKNNNEKWIQFQFDESKKFLSNVD